MKDYNKVGYLFDPDEFNNGSISSPDSTSVSREMKDDTLMFMTMAVSMTADNEMPIVSAYTKRTPKDIRGYYRTNSSTPAWVAPHFFFCDKKNWTYFNNPFRTEKKLKRFECSLSTDFSLTAEMSTNQKRYSSFLNKLWAAWLQSRGHNVIANVSFPDEYWENYWIEGWPKHSIIAVSSVGVLTHGNPLVWLKGMERIWNELKPIHVLRYGPKIPGEKTENCTYFINDNKRAAEYGW
jgi:hypothetical protein